MSIVWLRTSILHNRLRLIFLLSLLPITVIIIVFIALYIINSWINQEFWNSFISINIIWIIILFIRMFIWILLQKQIIFSFTWAKEITRKENPKIYNIVENLCISRGLPTPKIWIIEDNNLNAFATWWNPKRSRIVFSRWLINKLNKEEIEAVTGHELTHIINWDVKNMVIINIFIWAIWTIWYILLRSRWGRRNPFPLIWLFLYLASLILLPFINLAISRKKEFLADAGSVELTHDKDAMINALKKISKDSIIERIDWKWRYIASMFISSPRKEAKFLKSIRNLFSTHPSIEDRIDILNKY